MIIKGLVFWLYFLSNIVVGVNIIKEIKIGESTLLYLKKKFLKFLTSIEHNPQTRKIFGEVLGFVYYFFFYFFAHIFLIL